MSYALDLLKQLANGLARQFRPDREIIIRGLKKYDLKHSIMHINNGHVTDRQKEDGPSRAILETLHKDPASLKDHLGYLTRTSNSKILKSNTIYIRNEEGDSIDYLLSINHDIAGLVTANRPIKTLIDTEPQRDVRRRPEQTVHNVDDLLDTLVEQSVALIDEPAAPMNKEERVTAIQFLSDAGTFLVTKSGDRVSKYSGISKFTLYGYIDVNSRKSDDKKA